MDINKVLLAIGFGLLAHAFIGFHGFPYGDDFAYAPLAELRADPALFPKDDQIRQFANHAKIYNWVYDIGKATVGVELVFRAAVIVLAISATVALALILQALGVPLFALPAVLALGVVVRLDGLGRGDFGGLIAAFFHHHNVALVLGLFAIFAALRHRPWLAGALLGLAVFAQPMTAFHCAGIAGLAALLRFPVDAAKMAIAALLVALPAALPILSELMVSTQTDVTLNLVDAAYRFRAPHHYDPSWHAIGVTSLYLLVGFAASALLWGRDRAIGRFAFGLMLGFALLHSVTIVVYKFGIAEWVGFFILDANRSTPLLFALAPLLAIASLWTTQRLVSTLAMGVLLMCLAGANSTVGGLLLLVLAVLMWRVPDQARTRSVLAIGLASALILFLPNATFQPLIKPENRRLLERIAAETPQDALFVIPVGLFEFRVLAKRSAYVDFKMFSVAQPDQAALTRSRIVEVSQPAQENLGAIGWPAVELWSEDQRKAATCDNMMSILTVTSADYYLRALASEEQAPDCPTLTQVMQSDTLVLYGTSR